MSKYIIDLRPDCKVVQQICESNGQVGVGARSIQYLEELTADYINEHFGSLQDDAYKRGLEDAWEAARKIAEMWETIDNDELLGIFGLTAKIGESTIGTLFKKQTAAEAIEKLKVYEEKQKAEDEIKVGDIVERYLNGKLDSTGIYLGEDGDYWNCLFWTGAVFGTFAYPKNQFKKTEKHVDIASILEDMKHD